MTRYVVERTFPQPLTLTPEIAQQVKKVNDEGGVEWLFSFLSADKKKTYCVYESPNPDAIRTTSEQLNLPVNSIVELSGELRPDMFA